MRGTWGSVEYVFKYSSSSHVLSHVHPAVRIVRRLTRGWAAATGPHVPNGIDLIRPSDASNTLKPPPPPSSSTLTYGLCVSGAPFVRFPMSLVCSRDD